MKLSLEDARYIYKHGDDAMKRMILKIYSKDDIEDDFKKIKSFEDACNVLDLDFEAVTKMVNEISKTSKATAAMYKLHIIRKALNLKRELLLTENGNGGEIIYYPVTPFGATTSTFHNTHINDGVSEIIGSFHAEGCGYCVLGGEAVLSTNKGIGNYSQDNLTAYANTNSALFGCATKEIAEHFGKYFGMLIIEAKYGDTIKDFSIGTSKYEN